MRLLVLLQRYLAPGGLWMSQLIQGLESETVAIAARTQVNSDLPALPIPFYRLRSRNPLHRYLPKAVRPLSPLSGPKLLERAIVSRKANRVLCHFGTEAIEYREVWEKLDVPLFVHFHGFDATFNMLAQDGSGRRVHSEDYPSQIVRLSERALFIANSKNTFAKLIAAGVKAERIRLNYLGVPVRSELAERPMASIPTALYLGRLVDFKGPELVVHAFTKARRLGSPGKLIIAGDGPQQRLVEEAVETSPFREDIEMLGSVTSSAAENLVKKADIFVVHNCVGALTGQEEALNLAVLEAMAVGTPICGTRTGGVAETNVDEVTGFLTPPLDVDAQANALSTLFRESAIRREMGIAAHHRVLECFNQTTQIRSLGDILRAGDPGHLS